MRPHRTAVLGAALLTLLGVVLQLPAPILTQRLVDAAVQGSATVGGEGRGAALAAITRLGVLFAALVLVRHAFALAGEWVTLVLKERVILAIALRTLAQLHALPLRFFDGRHSTYLQARVMGDARAVEGALVRTLVTLLVNGLTFAVGLGFVVAVRPRLALPVLGFLLPFALLRVWSNARMRVLGQEMQERQALASASVSESLAGVRTLKTFGAETSQLRRLDGALDALRGSYVRTNGIALLGTVGTSAVVALCGAWLLWYGATAVIAGTMTLGEVVAVLAYLSFLYGPVNALVAANLGMQQASGAIRRIYEFLDERREPVDGESPTQVVGRVALRDVHFARPGSAPILRGVTLDVGPGTTLALVGRSGVGKSTLVELLARFVEPTRGTVTLDGRDVGRLALPALRAAVAIADQRTFLFAGSVRDNLRLARPDASDAELERVCRQMGIHDVVDALPRGYDTPIGERGARLSGGECQRLALARLLLRDPAVLVLDEATSALDSEAEAALHAVLATLRAGRTTIVIAHRLSSLLAASEVALLDDGRITERGTHAELLARDGGYARLFREQFAPLGPDAGVRSARGEREASPPVGAVSAPRDARPAPTLVRL